MTTHYDTLEIRDPRMRETDQAARLRDLVARALTAPGWARQLGAVDPQSITDRAALAALPILRKADLASRQAEAPPFGGFNVLEPRRARRLLLSPGPISEPEGGGTDWWGAARALHAAGFRAGHVAHNSFSYHLTPGAYILESGLHALGCAVIPAGPGNIEQQLAAIARYRPEGYVGTPDFLKILLDAAEGGGVDTSALSQALVSGAALPDTLREEFTARGVAVLQCYAIADVGVIAYETSALAGMVVNENVLVEIVRPGTGDPVANGEVGEIIVTSFNPDYPMIRLATGDLSAVAPGPSPCGRTNMRIRGWLGRADQSTKIKGMFVHPEQIAAIARRHPQLERLRLTVTREAERDIMTLTVECSAPTDDLQAAVGSTLQAVTKLNGLVRIVLPGTLPNDGKVIADERGRS